MKKLTLLLSLLTVISVQTYASKKKLTWDDVVAWNRITEKKIADDGKHIVAVTSTWLGETNLKLYTAGGKAIMECTRGHKAEFVNDNQLSFIIAPTQETLDSLERVKSKDIPYGDLFVYHIREQKVESIGKVLGHTVCKSSKRLVYTTKEEDGSTALNTKSLFFNAKYENVGKYELSEKSSILVYHTDSIPYEIYRVDLSSLDRKKIYSTDNPIKKMSVSKYEHGHIAFITGEKNDKSGISNKLFAYIRGKIKAVPHADDTPQNWIINHYGDLEYSKSGKRLIYGTSPEYMVEDTTIVPSRKAVVDIWHWDEPVLHTEQLVNLEKDKKRSYTAIYFTDKNKSVQLGTEDMPLAIIPNEGDAHYAYVNTNKPYTKELLWMGDMRSDLYVIDIKSGEKKQVFAGEYASVKSSPKGNYLYWYSRPDSAWHTYSIANDKRYVIASADDFITYDHLNDMPDHPYPQGDLLWSDKEDELLAPGRYDMWKVSPTNEYKPWNATKKGTRENRRFRPILLEEDQKSYDPKKKVMLSVFDNDSKSSSLAYFYYKDDELKMAYEILSTHSHSTGKNEFARKMTFGTPIKAKNADVIIYTKEDFNNSPDIHLIDTYFSSSPIKITNINPQQKDFNWGSVELVSWVSLKGDTLEGLLYKPENFDPTKKYPLICNFYERSSHMLNAYRTPEPHRSTIDYHYYTSNEYVIFSPDIKYYDGHPGQSCYDAVMPGLDKIISMGFVDEDRMAAQGHSWGGYQVAHLATVTDRFAAIESGAPVVNMISAYGGIRWGTGMNRAFQYEKTQSRLGATIWEAPELYKENSPIFNMDKVTTPILIMHNDMDGHVPWYQAIEFFIALRRLGKPAWYLNYTGEIHWPLKMANKIDFQTRMSKFFDHYLKGTEMPEWMEKGVPAVKR